MVTYNELFLLLTFIVSTISLVVTLTKKKYPPLSKSAVISFLIDSRANRLLGSLSGSIIPNDPHLSIID